VTGFVYFSDIGVLGPTWTSEYVQPSPTCAVAGDLSPICARLFEAWTYRAEKMRAKVPGLSEVDKTITHAIPPCTPLMRIPEPTNRPQCKVAGLTYSAYYWPTATPSGEDFCDANWTAPVGTPTIPGVPNTAVVSGLTLTSPDVYHFLKDVKIETYRGRADQPGGMGPAPYDLWELAKVLPVVTVAQPESSILQASKTCIGIEADQCSISFDPDFHIHDLAIVRLDILKKYGKSRCGSGKTEVMCQNCYQPTIAIPISEIVRQNGKVFGECDWALQEANNEGGWTSYTTSSVAAVLVKDVESTAFAPVITETTADRSTAVPLPGSPVPPEALPTNGT
jgi:hypothetical protein